LINLELSERFYHKVYCLQVDPEPTVKPKIKSKEKVVTKPPEPLPEIEKLNIFDAASEFPD